MDNFQPVNRVGKLITHDDTPSNVYWLQEFPDATATIFVSPGIDEGLLLPPVPTIKEVDGLYVGKEILGTAPFTDGVHRSIRGHIAQFIPEVRSADTLSFKAEISLVEPVVVENARIDSITLPIEMIRRSAHC